MPETENILKVAGLHKSFGRGGASVHVLRGLDLSVRRGEFLAVMGQSGCGKSTLLHVLGLMTPADTGADGKPCGEIILDGSVVPASSSKRTLLRRGKIGFVFQRFNLLGVLTARANIDISLHIRGLSSNGRAEELFKTLGVSDVINRKPSQMSIGQQQRIAVARAIAHEPAILLADEPTGNLDSENSRFLLELFRKMNVERKQTIVMITHSRSAAEMADRIVEMEDGVITNANG